MLKESEEEEPNQIELSRRGNGQGVYARKSGHDCHSVQSLAAGFIRLMQKYPRLKVKSKGNPDTQACQRVVRPKILG
ncbi:MAG: hypothetical protein IPO04_15260 [Cytophagaceae bacterium]|nr:hypothetical protein [Cytophagaceae bacterium]